MSSFDAFTYPGKRVLVVGAATGMGAAAAELAKDAGAEVVAMDRADITLPGVEAIRLAILPGPTDTPLAQANAAMWPGFGSDYRGELGIQASTSMEQAYPSLFLCSEAAKAITGITLVSDAGYFSSGITGSFPAASGIANFLSGRT